MTCERISEEQLDFHCTELANGESMFGLVTILIFLCLFIISPYIVSILTYCPIILLCIMGAIFFWSVENVHFKGTLTCLLAQFFNRH